MGILFKRKKDIFVEPADLNSMVDFTLLKPFATEEDLIKLINVAIKNSYGTICVNPVNVLFCRKYIDRNFEGRLKICSVVGFPLGETPTCVKVFEAKRALADGADEIDMVMSISRAKMGNWAYVRSDIARVVRACSRNVVKVILETCYLSRDEIIKACKICAKCRADFVKTSTGFGSGGATPEIVELMFDAVDGKCGVKASGGIATRSDAEFCVRKGATRIGTSRPI